MVERHVGQSVRTFKRRKSAAPKQKHTPEEANISSIERAIQAPTPTHLTPQVVEQLQRTHGNKFVQRLLARGKHDTEAGRSGGPATITPVQREMIQRAVGFELEDNGWSAVRGLNFPTAPDKLSNNPTKKETKKFSSDTKKFTKKRASFLKNAEKAPTMMDKDIKFRHAFSGDDQKFDPKTNTYVPVTKKNKFKYEQLHKAEPIFKGDNFNLEADEATERGADIEFVTDPAFADDQAGANQLIATFRDMVLLADYLIDRAKLAKQNGHTYFPVRNDNKPVAGTFTEGVLMTSPRQPGVNGAVQVTAGIRLDKMAKMMSLMQMGGDEGKVSDNLEDTRAMLGTKLSPPPKSTEDFKNFIFSVGGAPSAAREAMNKHNLAHKTEQVNSEELRGIVALMVQYIVTASSAVQGYAKTIAPLMARTDFARMFLIVPDTEQTILKAQNAAYFVDIVNNATAEVKKGVNFENPLFAGGFLHMYYKGSQKDDPATKALENLKVNEWARGIAQGVDFLTKHTFNMRLNDRDATQVKTDDKKPPKKDELESMGAFGPNTEDVGEDNTAAPIFENRAMGSWNHKDWQARALDVFEFYRKLNDGEDGELLKDSTAQYKNQSATEIYDLVQKRIKDKFGK